MKKILVFLVFAVGLTICVNASIVKPFYKVFQKTQRGGIVYLSNAALSTFSKDTLGIPPNIYTDGNNNDLISSYIDIDGNPSTFMSSSDKLNLPSCSEISFVGLFWGGNADATTVTTDGYKNRDKIKIKADNDSYIDLIADSVQYENKLYTTYLCYKDITSIFKKYGVNNRWTVANVYGQTGVKNSYAGWNIVVVYKNELQNLRQLTVYKGYAVVGPKAVNVSDPIDIPVTGFQTPPSPSPVTFEMGVYGYEGEAKYIGDSLLVKGSGNTKFENLFDALHPLDNVFNSTICRNGYMTPYRIPNYNFNSSIDANIFIPDNSTKKYIGNNATSITLRMTTSNEIYLTQCLSLAIDALTPDNRLGIRIKDLNGGSGAFVNPGDTLEYTLHGSNVGNDKSVDTYILNKLEGNAKFVPGSIVITKGPNAGMKTDKLGDDQAEYDPLTRTVKVRIGAGADGVFGGTVNNSPLATDSTVVKFRVTVTENMMDLNCDNLINNHAYIYGTGLTTGIKTESDKIPAIFDGNTCTVKEISNKTSVIINIPKKDIDPLSSNSPICPASTLMLFAPYSPNATYSWVGPNGFKSTQQNPVLLKAPLAASGVYSATISLNDKTCKYDLSTNVVVGGNCPPAVDNEYHIIYAGGTAKGDLTDAGDVSLDGKPLVVTPGTFTTPKGNTIVIDAAGIYTFTPKIGFVGKTDTVIVNICQQILPLCAEDTIFVTVLFLPPIVINENTTIVKNSSTVIDILKNGDKSFDGKPLTVSSTPIVAPLHGTVSANINGIFTYTPTLYYVGKDIVIYNLCDHQSPSRCWNDTVYIAVISPTILTNEHHTIPRGGTLTNNLTTNDVASDGKPLVIDINPILNPQHGTIVIKPNGSYTYTADKGYKGGLDSVKVNVCDHQTPPQCGVEVIYINITPSNDLPVANDDNIVGTLGIDTIRGNVGTNDKLSVDGPNYWMPNGVIVDKWINTNHGKVLLNVDGTYKYVPNLGYIGNDSFTYTIIDAVDGDKDEATVYITVNQSGSKPVARDDVFTSSSGNLAANDESSPFEPNIWSKLTDPSVGTVIVNNDGTFVYIPPTLNYSGTVTFTYRITDANYNTSDAKVTITISTGLADIALDNIKIYTIGKVIVTEGTADYRLSIMDMRGRELHNYLSSKNTSRMTVPKNGLYLIRATKNGVSFFKKIMVK